LILAPIVVNIVAFHLFLAPGGLPLAIVVAAALLLLAYAHRQSFEALFWTGTAQS